MFSEHNPCTPQILLIFLPISPKLSYIGCFPLEYELLREWEWELNLGPLIPCLILSFNLACATWGIFKLHASLDLYNLHVDDLVRINGAWLLKESEVSVLQANAKVAQKRECQTWNHMCQVQSSLEVTFCHSIVFCFHIVKPMMPILA